MQVDEKGNARHIGRGQVWTKGKQKFLVVNAARGMDDIVLVEIKETESTVVTRASLKADFRYRDDVEF